jgi:hypothetical protein
VLRKCPKCGHQRTPNEFYARNSACKPCVRDRASTRRRSLGIPKKDSLRSEELGKCCATCSATIPIRSIKKYRASKYCRLECAIKARTEHPAERFGRSYDITDSGCWEWTGKRMKFGYGWSFDGKKRQAAHRLSWLLHHGPIPGGLCVLHRCDNPPCVNPGHLFLGTKAENNWDKIAKGRARNAAGEAVSTHKLTADQVTCIIQDPRKNREISDLYGVSVSTISAIKAGRNWKWLTTKLAAEFAARSPDWQMRDAMENADA